MVPAASVAATSLPFGRDIPHPGPNEDRVALELALAESAVEAGAAPADGINRPVPNDESLEGLLAMDQAADQRAEAASAAAI
eukprot:11655086-Alexandrium_andersonii.AAC.1